MTNNIKAQVFAKYYGQKVFSKIRDTTVVWELDYNRISRISEHSCLKLRSISMLTDDEYLTLAKLAYGC